MALFDTNLEKKFLNSRNQVKLGCVYHIGINDRLSEWPYFSQTIVRLSTSTDRAVTHLRNNLGDLKTLPEEDEIQDTHERIITLKPVDLSSKKTIVLQGRLY